MTLDPRDKPEGDEERIRPKLIGNAPGVIWDVPSALAFDTHASVKRLIQSGMPEAQAEALVEVVSKTADMPDISELATKGDLEQLRLATKADIAIVDARITAVDSRITAVKGELIYWIIGASAVNALAQLVPHYVK